ncbi:MAG: arginine--tRNA ligase [Ruminobacter sp.]|jgi:arginyl-tRNA synthetase|nr:arginine--tRNA ligase [Ruminobacter sp.]
MKQIIQETLTSIVDNFKNEGLLPAETTTRIMVENTKDKKNGDYATNLAMLLAKPMKMKPIEIANLIVKAIPQNDKITKVEIAGPGFINFFVSKNYLASQIEAILNDQHLGVTLAPSPETIVVDYSSPNVAKEMAVHHIRSTVIGDAVVRIMEFLGHKVIRANHIGDWGTQFGMLIAYLEKKENENATNLELSDLEAFYREAKKCYESDEEFAVKARGYVVKLQSGDEYCLKMWKKLVNITMVQNQEIYNRLNISLTDKDIMGESLYNPMLKPLVEDLINKKLAVKDEGAMVVYLDKFADKDGNPRGVIVQKKDGGFLYTTTDIACTKYRCETLHANRIICFADSRQHEHLVMSWEIAKLAGYVPEGVVLEHGAFGMMLGKDGKPFKTRDGGTVKLKDLLNEAEARAAKLIESRNNDLPDEMKPEVIKTIAMGAVKYADLSKNRTTDYIFDWDNMLTFEGNTAPYLQYAYSRICSIFRKAADCSIGKVQITTDEEESLGQHLIKFNESVNAAANKIAPHIICSYIYDLAGLFMRFYEACPINKSDVPAEIKSSRLALCKATADIIKTGLNLLGINVLERM